MFASDSVIIKGQVVLASEYPSSDLSSNGRTMITRRSVLSGRVVGRLLDVCFEKFIGYNDVQHDVLIQDYFTELSADDREFILFGI